MRALSSFCALRFCISYTLSELPDVGPPPAYPKVEPFSFTHPNTSLSIGPWESGLAQGTLVWPGLAQESAASFYVVSNLLEASEVRKMLVILRDSGLEFDADPDSVDGMATHEFYLESSGGSENLATIRGKPDADRSVFAARSAARNAIANFTAPIVASRVLPFVNSRYAAACGATGCRVCQSLVRRYLPGERNTHGTHFDVQVS